VLAHAGEHNKNSWEENMPNRHQTGNGNAEPNANVFLAPALAASMWNPFLAAALKGNAQAQEGFGTIASEWRDFVGHRIQEDITLMQRLTQCSTPNQILSVCTDFWQKAGEDYGKELTTMTKLMTGVTSKMVMAAQSATDETSKQSSSWQRAAA
jgi:hypothetical protein